MIKLIHSNINWMNKRAFDQGLMLLPEFMHGNILRYKFSKDRKSRLIARLMLYKSLINEKKGHLINNFYTDKHNKPFIDGWKDFSISHSGELVLFSCHDSAIGVDVEVCNSILGENIDSFNCFHSSEKKYIRSSENSESAFYEIWVQKEAFLKAIGLGLLCDIESFNCHGPVVKYEDVSWYFHRISIIDGYKICLCTKRPHEIIDVKCFKSESLLLK